MSTSTLSSAASATRRSCSNSRRRSRRASISGDILFTVVRRIAEVAKVERAASCSFATKATSATSWPRATTSTCAIFPIDFNQYPEIREVMASGEPLVIRDTRTHPLLDVVRKGSAPGRLQLARAPAHLVRGQADGRALPARAPRPRLRHRTSSRSTAPSPTPPRSRCATRASLQTLRDQTQQITFARFEAERRLRTLQRYADFFESAADGIVVIDSEGKLLFLQPPRAQITGYGEADLIGRKLGDLFADDERERAETIRLGFQKGIYPQGVDIASAARTASEVMLSVNTSSVLREENAILLHVPRRHPRARHRGRAQTDQGVPRARHRQLGRRHRRADMRGHVLLFNRAAERCYGYDAGRSRRAI